MNKGLKNFLIALAAVAAVLAVGRVLMASAPGADIGKEITWIAGVIGIGVFTGLNAAAGNRKVSTASGEMRGRALAFPHVPGSGYLVILRPHKWGSRLGFDILLDGALAAHLMDARFVILTVASGPHRLTADVPNAPGASAAAPCEANVADGGVLFFETRTAMRLNRMDVSIVAVADTPALRARLGKIKMVAPMSAKTLA